MSYKDDEEEIVGIPDVGEENDVLLSPDDIDDSLLDDDLLVEDDLLTEDEEEESDFVGIDGSSEY